MQALSLARILKQRGLLQSQPVDGLLQILVLFADAAQGKIVLPQVLYAQLCEVDYPLRG